MSRLLLLLLVASACLAACDKSGPTQPQPATAPAQATEQAAPTAGDLTFCEQFRPPWGDQVWQEWWQKNPDAGEKWFTETPARMKKVDPARLAKCTQLDNMLVAWVPLKDLKPFAHLTKLRRLDIRFAPGVTDLSPLRELHNLEFLGIWGTSVGDLSPITGLEKLVEINARMTKITNLAPLAHMKSLAIIDLLKAPVSDLAPFAQMPLVTDIMTCSTEVKELSPLFPVAARITYLDLCNTPFRAYDELTKFRNLKTLKLWGLPLGKMTWLSGAAFPQMEELDLSGAQIDSLKPIESVTSLKKLQLLETKVIPAELAALKKRLPALQVVTQAD